MHLLIDKLYKNLLQVLDGFEILSRGENKLKERNIFIFLGPYFPIYSLHFDFFSYLFASQNEVFFVCEATILFVHIKIDCIYALWQRTRKWENKINK